jgi:hypothetical protein
MALLQGDRQGAKLAGFASSNTGRVPTALAVVCLAGFASSNTGQVLTALAVVCPRVWPVALESLSTRKYQRLAR